ncbi:hypothetical protein HD806DRAFT_468166 [Xylariaceae sp. AK1471]|nr:hypothetical protein HD806DRAFT_468166 [Xylariaceae sp. AK1471]
MSSLPPDPYRILGVSKDAQITEIRSAHRKLVLKCHPDKIQDPALKEAKQNEFQQVQQAYELLSNETEREKYDRKVEVFNDLARERERAKNSARSSSITRGTPKREYYHVKEASPRASTFAKPGPYGRTPPRSWEDTTAPRMYEEPTRYARKTASYEKEKPSKRDEERRRRREEDEWAREKEKEKVREARKAKDRKEEKDRMAREDREREKRRDEKKRAQNDRDKEREKERKNASAEKLRTRQPIIETSESSDSSDDDVVYEPPPPKADKKKSSSSRKTEDIDPPSTSERTRKYSGNMEQAIRYLTRSSGKAPAAFVRSQTYSGEGSSKAFNTPMVPTPPPAPGAPFAPPPPIAEPGETSEEDMARRSSARPSLRRMSHETSRSSREKSSSHKKSSSSRDHQPVIVESGSPSARIIPSLQKSHSERIPSHADRVPPLSRAQTESFTRPIPVPLSRSETWFPATDRERERHERSRSRPTPTYSDEEDSEAERERRHRRSRRTHSPEPMPIPMPAQTHHRYTVDGTKSIPVRQKTYHEQPKSRVYQKGGVHIIPNSSARRGPTASYARDYYADEPAQVFQKVKYATQFGEHNIQYSDLPYSGSHRSDGVYAV